MAKTRKEFLVKVTGKGTFPVDMLRYDSAVPASEEDAGLIEDTFQPRFPREPMTITVRMMRAPTTARWESFAWKVSDVDERTYNA
jgi:hypothetical protein